MITYNLTADNLKVRDSITKFMKTVLYLNYYLKPKVHIEVLSSDFNFKGRMSEFNTILESLNVEYTRNSWLFIHDNIKIQFSLSNE